MASVEFDCAGITMRSEAERPRALLTNSDGEYLSLGFPNESNYDGYFVKRDGVRCKTLQDISSEEAFSSIVVDGYCVERNTTKDRQRIELLDNGVLVNCRGSFRVTFDCKRLYDESDQGRIYSIELHPSADGSASGTLGNVTTADICYTKYSDGSKTSVAYRIFCSIATTLAVDRLDSWREESYAYDRRRGTHSTPWVYDAFILRGDGDCAISEGSTKEEARRKAVDLLVRKDAYVRKHRSVISGRTPALSPHALLAWRSLDALTTTTGIMAGLPWFFHEWSRDELISAGGLIAVRDYPRVISILEKWYSAIRPDGTLPAIYPNEGLASSDAPGWLGKRTRDLLVKLSDERLLHRVPSDMILRWRDLTGKMIDGYASRMRYDLVFSEYNTTWMDTSKDDDGRAGCRIEIQALFLALYDAHAHLCLLTKAPVDETRKEISRRVLAAVHERLVVEIDGMPSLLDGLHADGRKDLTVRPNIFLAWYVAPRLFDTAQWRSFFAFSLKHLWLSWGGLSSISVNDSKYRPSYTGEDVASYHRGDSWYFMNNIAAMALLETGADTRGHADKIVAASMRDLMSLGYVGHCSEISSASLQEACGCHAQAWSASTLLELLIRHQR